MNKYVYTSDNAEIYQTLGIDNTTYALEFQEVAKLLGNLSGKTILDFGSGSGRSSKFLLNLGARNIVGVDHNGNMVNEAQKSTKSDQISFIKIDDKIPFPDEHFDCAVALSVFIEIRTKKEMVRICTEIARVLKHGAQLIIGSTNPRAFGKDFRNFSYTEPKTKKGGELAICTIHTDGKSFDIEDTYWNESDYIEALQNADLEVDSVSYPLPSDKETWDTDENNTSPFIVIAAHKK